MTEVKSAVDNLKWNCIYSPTRLIEMIPCQQEDIDQFILDCRMVQMTMLIPGDLAFDCSQHGRQTLVCVLWSNMSKHIVRVTADCDNNSVYELNPKCLNPSPFLVNYVDESACLDVLTKTLNIHLAIENVRRLNFDRRVQASDNSEKPWSLQKFEHFLNMNNKGERSGRFHYNHQTGLRELHPLKLNVYRSCMKVAEVFLQLDDKQNKSSYDLKPEVVDRSDNEVKRIIKLLKLQGEMYAQSTLQKRYRALNNLHVITSSTVTNETNQANNSSLFPLNSEKTPLPLPPVATDFSYVHTNSNCPNSSQKLSILLSPSASCSGSCKAQAASNSVDNFTFIEPHQTLTVHAKMSEPTVESLSRTLPSSVVLSFEQKTAQFPRTSLAEESNVAFAKSSLPHRSAGHIPLVEQPECHHSSSNSNNITATNTFAAEESFSQSSYNSNTLALQNLLNPLNNTDSPVISLTSEEFQNLCSCHTSNAKSPQIHQPSELSHNYAKHPNEAQQGGMEDRRQVRQLFNPATAYSSASSSTNYTKYSVRSNVINKGSTSSQTPHQEQTADKSSHASNLQSEEQEPFLAESMSGYLCINSTSDQAALMSIISAKSEALSTRMPLEDSENRAIDGKDFGEQEKFNDIVKLSNDEENNGFECSRATTPLLSELNNINSFGKTISDGEDYNFGHMSQVAAVKQNASVLQSAVDGVIDENSMNNHYSVIEAHCKSIYTLKEKQNYQKENSNNPENNMSSSSSCKQSERTSSALEATSVVVEPYSMTTTVQVHGAHDDLINALSYIPTAQYYDVDQGESDSGPNLLNQFGFQQAETSFSECAQYATQTHSPANEYDNNPYQTQKQLFACGYQLSLHQNHHPYLIEACVPRAIISKQRGQLLHLESFKINIEFKLFWKQQVAALKSDEKDATHTTIGTSNNSVASALEQLINSNHIPQVEGIILDQNLETALVQFCEIQRGDKLLAIDSVPLFNKTVEIAKHILESIMEEPGDENNDVKLLFLRLPDINLPKIKSLAHSDTTTVLTTAAKTQIGLKLLSTSKSVGRPRKLSKRPIDLTCDIEPTPPTTSHAADESTARGLELCTSFLHKKKRNRNSLTNSNTFSIKRVTPIIVSKRECLGKRNVKRKQQQHADMKKVYCDKDSVERADVELALQCGQRRSRESEIEEKQRNDLLKRLNIGAQIWAKESRESKERFQAKVHSIDPGGKFIEVKWEGVNSIGVVEVHPTMIQLFEDMINEGRSTRTRTV